MVEAEPNLLPPELMDGYEKPPHECGIFGMYAPGQPVAAMTVIGLNQLQHRGQSGGGVFVYTDEGRPVGTKDVGLVANALRAAIPVTPGSESPYDLYGSPISVGHVRYSTTGRNEIRGVQPFVKPGFSLVVASNGNLPVLEPLKEKYDIFNPDPASDTEDAFLLLQDSFERHGDFLEAMHEMLPQFEGGCNLLASDGENLFASRDVWGYRPVCLGVLPDGGGYVVSSETVALHSVGAEFLRDLEPGEIVKIGPDGIESTLMNRHEDRKTCRYEYNYTSHPASDIDGSNVYMSRVNTGKRLAKSALVAADVVIAAPESGRGVAEGYAQESGIPLSQGLIVNNGAKRTFIERGLAREAMIKYKYIPIVAVLKGQRVILCDDSLIKGKTMKAVVTLLKDAGAAEVHVRLGSPRFEHPCFMGMETDKEELVASYMTDAEIAHYIGATSVAFVSVEDNDKAIVEAALDPANPRNLKVGQFCTGCADGRYPSQVPGPISLGMPVLARSLVGSVR